MKISWPLRYHFLVYRREQLWLPLGLWALFALIVAMFRQETKAAEIAADFLGVVLPLLAGVLAASALVDDPALELQLAAPRQPWRIMLERLAMILGLVTVTALTFQAFLIFLGLDLAQIGNPATRQLVWLIPSLAMMGLSSVAALAFAQGTVGVLAVGLVWLIELLLRHWFAANSWARHVFLYLGLMLPKSPSLPANYVCLLGLTVVFAGGASLLLKQEERYL